MNGIEEHNDSLDYIIKCAELVGIEITENTPIDMAFVAELVKRVYDKGHFDGMKAQAFHEELCREESEEQTDEENDIPSVLFKDCDYITGKATDNVTYDECIYCYRYNICKKCYIEKHSNEGKL